MARVTAADRRKTGMRKPGARGKFPVRTKAQALSAIRLRHHAKGVSAEEVLNHVARSRWGKDPEVRRKIREARERDRKRKRRK